MKLSGRRSKKKEKKRERETETISVIFRDFSPVFTKNFADHKPTGPVNHENPKAQI